MSGKADVEFYQKLKDLQGKQHETEQQRHDLEKQLNSYIKSDHRLARLKAIRLQNYWKKICEDENRSKWRNEQLLRDFDRVESHMATLGERTERLRTMKKQYEDYIEKTYPNWKEKILHQQRLKRHVERQQQLEAEAQAQSAVAAAAHMTYLPAAQVPGGIYNIPAPAVSTVTPGPPVMVAPDGAPLYASTPVLGGHRIPSQTIPQDSIYHQPVPQPVAVPITVPTPAVAGTPAAGYVHLPDQQAAYRISSTLPAPASPAPAGIPTGTETIPLQRTSQIPGTAPIQRQAVSVPQQVQNLVSSPPDVIEDSEDSSIDEEVIKPTSSPRRVPSGYQPTPQEQQPAGRVRTDDTDDFSSDESLPLSKEAPKITQTTAAERAQTPDSLYLRPDITLEGLYNLMSAIEGEIPNAAHTVDLYKADMPSDSVKREIMENANRGSMLSHMNSPSISMVIIDQLQLLVANCENGCLLPDSILYRPSPSATQETVRRDIHPMSRTFWDRLCEHFINLLRYNVLVEQEIAEIFAPLLLNEDSPYDSGATTLLLYVLQNANVEVIHSPASTSTFSTLSPRKRADDADVKPQLIVPPSIKEAPEVDIKPDSSSEEEDFFSQPVPKVDAALTQTAAYRQLLGGTMSTTQHTVSYVDSDEDEDGVEAMLGSAIYGKKQKQASPLHKPEAERVDSPSKDQSGPLSPRGGSRVSSPSLGSTGGGYVPSAMDTDRKSGTGSYASTGKSAKKGPAFLGDSDTDEDISIPGMNASEQKSFSRPAPDVDDFDFYG